MAIAYSFPNEPRDDAIKLYITTVDETLDKVFNMSPKERTRIIGSLRKERGRYWDVTLHDLPLYCAARLAGVQILYPYFDMFEDRYTKLIESEGDDRRCDRADATAQGPD